MTTLRANEEVLILLPVRTGTLLTSWKGPFVKRCSPINYIHDVRGNKKICPYRHVEKILPREEGHVEETLAQASKYGARVNTLAMINDRDGVNDGFREGIPFPVFNSIAECPH